MKESSTWTALRNPAFRRLWIGTVISGTCVAAHDSGATWMMNIFTGSPFLISFISTVASLPFFLFTLPAGALTDKVDRKKLICFVNVGLPGTAAGLAVLVWLHLLSPYLAPVSAFLSELGLLGNGAQLHRSRRPGLFAWFLTPLVAKILSLDVGAVDSIGGLYGSLEPISGCRFPARQSHPMRTAIESLSKQASPGLYITRQSQGLLHETNRN
jgi:MFS family permease